MDHGTPQSLRDQKSSEKIPFSIAKDPGGLYHPARSVKPVWLISSVGRAAD